MANRWINDKIRLAIYSRDNCTCFYCNQVCVFHETADNRLTLDHVQPRSKAGQHYHENLITACAKCNTARGDMDINLWLELIGRDPLALELRLAKKLDHGLLAKIKKMSIQAARMHVLAI